MDQITLFLNLVDRIGAVGAMLIVLTLVVISGGVQFFSFFLKKKRNKDLINIVKLEINAALNELITKTQIFDKDISIVKQNQDKLTDVIEKLAEAIASVNLKMKNVMVEKDMLEIIRIFISKVLLFEFSKIVMEYFSKFRDNPEQRQDLYYQCKLELKNKWSDVINILSNFKFPMNVSALIDKKFKRDEICGDEGIVGKILQITFIPALSVKNKYERIVNFHNLFSQQVVAFVEEEIKTKEVSQGNDT